MERLLAMEGASLTPLHASIEEKIAETIAQSLGVYIPGTARCFRVNASEEKLDVLAKTLGEQPEVERELFYLEQRPTCGRRPTDATRYTKRQYPR